MPELKDIPIMWVVMGIIAIPMFLGFFQAAGCDLYRMIRKQDASGKCMEHMFFTKDMTEMKEKQIILREVRLPRIETNLELILKGQNDMKDDIKKLFELWDRKDIGH